jgi:protein-L-isoaspartate(D-aspartate) O-methyltransferase
MVIIMCEKLQLEEGNKVLEVGAGSGYHAAICAEIVAPLSSKKGGHVYTIERLRPLAEFARENLRRTGYSDRVTVIVGDGTLGYRKVMPFDRILVTAAAPEIPDTLVRQLKVGGIMAIPIGGRHGWQELFTVKKTKRNESVTTSVGGVAFVPLIGKHGWRNKE